MSNQVEHKDSTLQVAANAAFGTQQTTLKNHIHCSGIGLHSGNKISMSLYPAEPDTGIVFRRTDIPGQNAVIPARYNLVSDTRLCTTLSNDANVRVATVEHLMAALAGCEVDNVVVEINGPEVPIMDGSAEPFVFLIECAGTVRQKAPRRIVHIKQAVSIFEGGAEASIAPATSNRSGLTIDLNIDFKNSAIGQQNLTVTVSSNSFKSEICRARTFGFLEDVEALRQAGLAQGGSLDNAVVISGSKVLNEDGLRFEDEFVRHKILDCIGDLYLAGNPVIGAFSGLRSGHELHNKLLRRLFADPSAWEIIPMDEYMEMPAPIWQPEAALAIA
ncbi:MAG: UDP-3-O-acyl-N-acetylglucosamine deacetylase [Proteobacteria bacterium]|nr:UDP-3-O-acyl-N-acetylglucosamine deacetylase [Pseudomonadota bacterium]